MYLIFAIQKLILNGRHIISIPSGHKVKIGVRTLFDAPAYSYSIDWDNTDKRWKEKNIVWFGTSIPAGGPWGIDIINAYPKYVGDMLGANVWNEAVGSSQLQGKVEIVSSVDYAEYTRRMGHTVAQKSGNI